MRKTTPQRRPWRTRSLGLGLLEAPHEIVNRLHAAGGVTLGKRGPQCRCPRVALGPFDIAPLIAFSPTDEAFVDAHALQRNTRVDGLKTGAPPPMTR